MKYYLVNMMERMGDYEYPSNFVIARDKEIDEEVEGHILARDNRDSGMDDWDEDMQGYWYDGVGITLLPEIVKINKITFDKLRKLL